MPPPNPPPQLQRLLLPNLLPPLQRQPLVLQWRLLQPLPLLHPLLPPLLLLQLLLQRLLLLLQPPLPHLLPRPLHPLPPPHPLLPPPLHPLPPPPPPHPFPPWCRQPCRCQAATR